MALRHCSPTPTFSSRLPIIPSTSLLSWKPFPFPLVRPLLKIKLPRYLCYSVQPKDRDSEIGFQQDQYQEEEEESDKSNIAPINEELNKKKQRLQTGGGAGRGSADSTDWISSSLTRRFGLAGGLAWFGFLAFGVISEQVKTRLEVSQEQQNIRVQYLTTLQSEMGPYPSSLISDSEDHNSTLESTPSTIRVLDPKFSASTLFDEVVQDEEEAESSTQSILIEESLLEVTPSLDDPEVYEIYDISSSHMFDTE